MPFSPAPAEIPSEVLSRLVAAWRLQVAKGGLDLHPVRGGAGLDYGLGGDPADGRHAGGVSDRHCQPRTTAALLSWKGSDRASRPHLWHGLIAAARASFDTLNLQGPLEQNRPPTACVLAGLQDEIGETAVTGVVSVASDSEEAEIQFEVGLAFRCLACIRHTTVSLSACLCIASATSPWPILPLPFNAAIS